jgi:hypothetical protein
MLFFAALSAQAQERPGRHALIIGVSQYADPAASTLRGVPFDVDSARRIAEAMGFPQPT